MLSPFAPYRNLFFASARPFSPSCCSRVRWLLLFCCCHAFRYHLWSAAQCLMFERTIMHEHNCCGYLFQQSKECSQKREESNESQNSSSQIHSHWPLQISCARLQRHLYLHVVLCKSHSPKITETIHGSHTKKANVSLLVLPFLSLVQSLSLLHPDPRTSTYQPFGHHNPRFNLRHGLPS